MPFPDIPRLRAGSSRRPTILARLLLPVCFFCGQLFTTAGIAQDFEDGRTAYEAGDYKKALAILQPLAEAGDSQAQVTIGIMYDNGLGVASDPAEALKWYIRAAEQGIPEVQHDVGVKYFQGTGTDQDFAEAARWWEQSANAGLADSQFNLGLMYYRGLGVNRDYDKAAGLFLKAAEQNHSQAQYSLAVMHAFGHGMEKNYGMALKWFRRSAEQGMAEAQFNIGAFYENGYGLEKDMDAALDWYRRAAAKGLPEAEKKVEEIESRKPGGETAQAAIDQPPQAPVKAAPHEEQPPSETTTARMEEIPKAVSRPVPSEGIKREDWVFSQNPASYTLQLSSVLNEQDIVKFIRENNIVSESAYIKVVVKGTTRYTAVYGVYATYDEAQKAIQQLPAKVRDGKPWIRNFGVLQKLLGES